jgi:hypothetical protein
VGNYVFMIPDTQRNMCWHQIISNPTDLCNCMC